MDIGTGIAIAGACYFASQSWPSKEMSNTGKWISLIATSCLIIALLLK